MLFDILSSLDDAGNPSSNPPDATNNWTTDASQEHAPSSGPGNRGVRNLVKQFIDDEAAEANDAEMESELG